MLKTRVIPCLLLDDGGLVKTTKFKRPSYIGDPINAVRIFNEKEVDELIFLDITATTSGRGIDFGLIEDIASEAFMPFAYGGGIKTLADAQKVFSLGVEKVVLNHAAHEAPGLISDIAQRYGSQAVVISIDIKKNLFGSYEIFYNSGKNKASVGLVEFLKEVESLGAGEVFVNSMDRDGTFSGYDLKLLRTISDNSNIPIVACGGAKDVGDFEKAIKEGQVTAVSAGSMFVFYGKHRAVLITYPSPEELKNKLDVL